MSTLLVKTEENSNNNINFDKCNIEITYLHKAGKIDYDDKAITKEYTDVKKLLGLTPHREV